VPEDAMAFYGFARTNNQKGITIPSQRTFIYYWHKVRGRDATPCVRATSFLFFHFVCYWVAIMPTIASIISFLVHFLGLFFLRTLCVGVTFLFSPFFLHYFFPVTFPLQTPSDPHRHRPVRQERRPAQLDVQQRCGRRGQGQGPDQGGGVGAPEGRRRRRRQRLGPRGPRPVGGNNRARVWAVVDCGGVGV